MGGLFLQLFPVAWGHKLKMTMYIICVTTFSKEDVHEVLYKDYVIGPVCQRLCCMI